MTSNDPHVSRPQPLSSALLLRSARSWPHPLALPPPDPGSSRALCPASDSLEGLTLAPKPQDTT